METRMEVCRRNSHPGSRRRVDTVRKRRPQAVRMVRAVARRAGHRAGDRVAGRPPARLRRRVGAVVGASGRHRRWISARGIDRGVGAGQGTRAREPRTEACQRDSEASGEFLRGGARPPTQEIVDFIDDNRDEFGVEPICTVLRSQGAVAPSTYYAAKTRPSVAAGPA